MTGGACSFCSKPEDQVHVLIPGESAAICNECLELCSELVAGDEADGASVHGGERASEPADAACSFCSRDRQRVRALVAGPGVQICDECVRRCLDGLAERGE